MSRGYPFPDLAKLTRALALRGWTRTMLAEKAGITDVLAARVVAGRPVEVGTMERVSAALLANPPQTATAAFVLDEAAS